MNNPLTSTPVDSRPAVVRRILIPAAIAITVVQAALNALIILGEENGPETDGRYISSVVLPLVAAVVVFAIVMASALRKESFAGTALTLSVLALLLFPVFWLGITLVFAAGGTMLGWAGLGIADGVGRSRAAFVIGMLAAVGTLAAYVAVWIEAPGFQ
jgi:hypothetical protein